MSFKSVKIEQGVGTSTIVSGVESNRRVVFRYSLTADGDVTFRFADSIGRLTGDMRLSPGSSLFRSAWCFSGYGENLLIIAAGSGLIVGHIEYDLEYGLPPVPLQTVGALFEDGEAVLFEDGEAVLFEG